MPKKKQVTFQNNIPGKYIPRDDSPATTGFRSGINPNRFNSKMAELLASSSSSSSTTMNNENEPISTNIKSSQDNPILSTESDMTNINSSRVPSRLIHRRIVTMLETLRGRGGNSEITSPPTSSRLTPSHAESKSQPITFGQLRQATTSTLPPSSTAVDEISSSKISSARSYTDLISTNPSDKQSYRTNVKSLIIDDHSDLISATSISKTKLSSKHQSNKERLQYSPSLEQLLEQHNVVPRMREERDEQQSQPPLTVDEILATYYSKVKVPTTADTQSTLQTSSYPNNNTAFYMNSSPLVWDSSQTNHLFIPSPRLTLNEQNRNRPPPPSYSSSVASGHRPPPSTNNLAQHLIRPPIPSTIRDPIYSGPQLLPGNSSLNVMTNTSVRPPPPRYEVSSTNIERSHSALSSMNRPNYSQINPPQAGFDREFSRLLYGKDGGKNRQSRQKRKAFSDPVKKSVEEAGRSIDKTHRRLTHLNKTHTVKEEEESCSDSNDIDKYDKNLFPSRHFHRKSDFIENNRESAKKPIVPPNPLLRRRVPSFLRVYSQASSSNDILLKWQFFSLLELESFDAMMTKLYKDENFIRVQFYETYRAALTSTLASKKSLNKINNYDDYDGITTTAL